MRYSSELESVMQRMSQTMVPRLREAVTDTVMIESETIDLEDIRTSKTLEDVYEKSLEQLQERIREAGAIPERSFWVTRHDKSNPFVARSYFAVECRVIRNDTPTNET